MAIISFYSSGNNKNIILWSLLKKLQNNKLNHDIFINIILNVVVHVQSCTTSNLKAGVKNLQLSPN